MSKNRGGKPGKKERRSVVLAQRELDLKRVIEAGVDREPRTKVKRMANGIVKTYVVPGRKLDQEIARIKKEIEILKKRI